MYNNINILTAELYTKTVTVANFMLGVFYHIFINERMRGFKAIRLGKSTHGLLRPFLLVPVNYPNSVFAQQGNYLTASAISTHQRKVKTVI